MEKSRALKYDPNSRALITKTRKKDPQLVETAIGNAGNQATIPDHLAQMLPNKGLRYRSRLIAPKIHVGIKSLPKGSLPRPIGTIRGH